MNLKVISFQLADSIDIKLFKTTFPAPSIMLIRMNCSIYIASNKYLYVFKYGIVCFLGYSETEMAAFFQMIGPYCKNLFDQQAER